MAGTTVRGATLMANCRIPDILCLRCRGSNGRGPGEPAGKVDVGHRSVLVSQRLGHRGERAPCPLPRYTALSRATTDAATVTAGPFFRLTPVYKK